MTWNFTTASSASAFSHTFFVNVGMPPRPEPPHDPGYMPPPGALVMRARKLADGSWYVPGCKQRSLALGAGNG